jgi:serine phosphatase RsbU (regulator of sigma subunit)
MSQDQGVSNHGDLSRSRAFREASLRSEVKRAYAVIAVLLVSMLSLFVRNFSYVIDPRVRSIGAGLGLSIIVQCIAILVARRAARHARAIPMWFTFSTVVIEGLVPSGMILAQAASGALPPYVALLTPALLAYGLFGSMTTLRLSPWLCVVQGGVGSIGYSSVLAYTRHRFGSVPESMGLPIAAYLNVPVLIFVGSLASAGVAREIRRHVQAALSEAETRRQIERIEQDLSIARSIQQALLPGTPPAIPGFDIAGWNRPADETGGDYYDWHTLPDGAWIVTLADVSGHGIGPAMVTAACRAYMRASAMHHPDLASLATRVNHLLAQDLPDGRFVTMASVMIRPSDRPTNATGIPIALLSAGHGPIALYLNASGTVQDILPECMPLAIADVEFGPVDMLSLAPGDVLALVTDGFVEWSKPGTDGKRDQFGIERLRDSLRRHAGQSASDMIQSIAGDVEAFAQGHAQQDDLTMVVIRRVT